MMDPTVPYLPPEMIGEILMNIEDGRDLINTIKALLLTPLYYSAIVNDNYLWRHLLKLNYPYYNLKSTEHKLKTLTMMLKCYPTRLNEENWKIALLIEKEASAYQCPVSYMIMRGDVAGECNDLDYRLVKKLFDTEFIYCDTNPMVSTPKSEWIINILNNAKNSCDGMSASWRKAFKVFVNTYLGTPVSQYLKEPECICNAAVNAIHTRECYSSKHNERKLRELNTRPMVSLYLLETMSSTYKLYDIYRKEI